jgi:Tfp pilus assembly protein PilN
VSQQINLYNPLFQKKEKPFSVRTMGQALGLIALGVAGLYAYAVAHTHSVERLANQLNQQLTSQRDQVAQLAKVPVRVPSKTLEAEAARLEIEVRSRQTTLQALNTGELGNTAGFSDFFAALGRRAVPGVWLTSVKIADSGNELVVQGRALRAELMPAFLRALNNEPVMRGRKVTEMKLTAKAAPKAVEGKPAADEPASFIEFSLTAPLQVAEAPAPAAAGNP